MKKWEIRVPFDYDGTMNPDDVRHLEKEVERMMKSRRLSPLPESAKVVCVEVVEECPCCEKPEPWCCCLFQTRVVDCRPDGSTVSETFCLDHERIVEDYNGTQH